MNTPSMTRTASTLTARALRAALAASLTLAVGCGGEDPAAPAAAGADLDGTWQTACAPTAVGFATTTLTYANLALRGAYTEYSDAVCTQAIHVSRWTGTAAVSGPARDGATPLDVTFATFTSTALTADNAAQNNSYRYCGATDWRANAERDVLGADCQGFAIPRGARSLDLYQVAGSALRFGQNARILVNPPESSRPTAIDAARVFTRR